MGVTDEPGRILPLPRDHLLSRLMVARQGSHSLKMMLPQQSRECFSIPRTFRVPGHVSDLATQDALQAARCVHL